MNLCKTLEPEDYDNLEGLELFGQVVGRFPVRVDHPHRKWEYGIALTALGLAGVESVLDVGGAHSAFGCMCQELGMEVKIIDPAPSPKGYPVPQRREDFFDYGGPKVEAVTCLSVIEHVPDDLAFWAKVLWTAEKVVVLTTDFSLDGLARVRDHLRTYTPDTLSSLLALARRRGWKPVGEPAWHDTGPHVNGYNFASLTVTKCMT